MHLELPEPRGMELLALHHSLGLPPGMLTPGVSDQPAWVEQTFTALKKALRQSCCWQVGGRPACSEVSAPR